MFKWQWSLDLTTIALFRNTAANEGGGILAPVVRRFANNKYHYQQTWLTQATITSAMVAGFSTEAALIQNSLLQAVP
jgi:hypothetical protein